MLTLTLLILLSQESDGDKWTQLIESRLTRNSQALTERFWDDEIRSDLAMQEYLLTLGQNGDPSSMDRVVAFFDHPVLQATALFAYGEIDGAPLGPLLAARTKVKAQNLPYLLEACTKLARDDQKAAVAKLWSDLDLPTKKQSTHFFYQVANPSLSEQIVNSLLTSGKPDLHGGVYCLFRGRVEITAEQLSQILEIYKPYRQTLIHALRIGVTQPTDALVDQVLDLTLHRDWRVRVNALNALMRLDVSKGMSRAQVMLTLDEQPNVRKSAYAAMVSLGDIEKDKDLKQLAKKDSAGQSKGLVSAASEDPLRFYDLINLWPKSEDRWKRYSALSYWGKIGGDDVVGELTRLSSDPDPVTSAIALAQLAETGSAEIATPLQAVMETQDAFKLTAVVNYLAKNPDAYAKHKDKLDELVSKSYTESDFHFAYVDKLKDFVGEDTVSANLQKLLNHPDYLVRLKAYQSLPEKTREQHDSVFKGGWTRNVPDGVRKRAIDNISNRKQIRWTLDTNKGKVVIGLKPGYAPITCANISELTAQGYFNDMPLHRVVPNFVVQGGDSRGDGSGGPGYAIPCEVNMLRYQRGAVGMALSGKDTGGSQFFICHSDQPHLDGGYTVFGSVLEGMDVVDNLEEGDRILKATVSN